MMKSMRELIGVYEASKRGGTLNPSALYPEESAGWWLKDHGVNALKAFDQKFPRLTEPTSGDVRKLIADALLLDTFQIR